MVQKRGEGCSPFAGPFWRCRSLGKFQPHFASVSGVCHLGAIQSPKGTRCVLALFTKVLHALVFVGPARGAQCLSGGLGMSRASSATLRLVIFFETLWGCWGASRMGSGKGIEGNSPANRVSANSCEAVGLRGACFGLGSIYTGDSRFELPALICPNL